MILEYKIDYRSNLEIFEKIFLKTLNQHSLEGKILRDGNILKCYIQADKTEEFEEFSTHFAQILPHSIFLYDTEVNVVENMPEQSSTISDKKTATPFCLECLNSASNPESKDYYNIFTQCDICGYNIKGEAKNYSAQIKELAKLIKDNHTVKINTFYGVYNIGLITQNCNFFNFDILAYDLANIAKYTHAKDSDLKALASFEKPYVKLKTNLQFKTDFSLVESEIIRFKLPDDFILHFLMKELQEFGIGMIFITKESIPNDSEFALFTPEELEPLEVVTANSYVAIVKGNRCLPELKNTTQNSIPPVGAFYSVIKEHNLLKKYDNIAGVYLSQTHQNAILAHGKKFGTISYLMLEFNFGSTKEIFEQIQNSSQTAKKLIENYKKKFPELYDKIIDIKFEDSSFNIYRFWGLLALILDLGSFDNLQDGSNALLENCMHFLGERGPRIDYKLIKEDNNTRLDPLMIIRSAISFKLAGIDNLGLSYGIMESFVEFIVSQLDELKDSMDIKAVAFSGSLLNNAKVFAKVVQESVSNHKIYFNTQLPTDNKNLFYADEAAIND